MYVCVLYVCMYVCMHVCMYVKFYSIYAYVFTYISVDRLVAEEGGINMMIILMLTSQEQGERNSKITNIEMEPVRENGRHTRVWSCFSLCHTVSPVHPRAQLRRE